LKNNNAERTRHLDVMYHYVVTLDNNVSIEIEFMNPDKNVAAIFTKIPSNESFNRKNNIPGQKKDKFNIERKRFKRKVIILLL
jgi:hypothetical protein